MTDIRARFAGLGRTFIGLGVALALAGSVVAQTAGGDPNLALPNEIVRVELDDHAMTGLVTHLPEGGPYRRGLVLFPGHPGILDLREEDGVIRYKLPGNFLVRSRRHWLDRDTLVLLVDAPSDQLATFSQRFRETPRYGADVAALLRATGARYGVTEWVFIGTSEGSVSAFHAARMNPDLASRLVLTSSLFLANRHGPGLSGADLAQMPARSLWVHHRDDPCPYTAYRDARDFAGRSGKPLLTVNGGGPGRGDACAAFTAHGYVGMEKETIRAIQEWMATDRVADIGP